MSMLRPSAKWRPCSKPRLCSAAAGGFHQDRMQASPLTVKPPPLMASVRTPESHDDLEAVSMLRARSFYVYPKERAFAGERHQLMKAREELDALMIRDVQTRKGGNANRDECICLMAVAPLEDVRQGGAEVPEELILGDGNTTLVGTLDLVIARALPGEVLIGQVQNASYLANVCCADVARRRGVAAHMVKSARARSRMLGMEAMYVHAMAVNHIGRALYTSLGFQVEQEESSNQAHYRGHCLDGIEGRGRTVLLRDARL